MWPFEYENNADTEQKMNMMCGYDHNFEYILSLVGRGKPA